MAATDKRSSYRQQLLASIHGNLLIISRSNNRPIKWPAFLPSTISFCNLFWTIINSRNLHQVQRTNKNTEIYFYFNYILSSSQWVAHQRPSFALNSDKFPNSRHLTTLPDSTEKSKQGNLEWRRIKNQIKLILAHRESSKSGSAISGEKTKKIYW